MNICRERLDLLAFRLCCFTLCRLDFCVPFPYSVWRRKWNSIVSIPDHCRFIYLSYRARIDFILILKLTWLVLNICRDTQTYLQIISLGCTGYEYEEYCPFRLLCWCSHAFTQSLYSINISINSSRNLRSRPLRLVAIKIVCIKTGKGSETKLENRKIR